MSKVKIKKSWFSLEMFIITALVIKLMLAGGYFLVVHNGFLIGEAQAADEEQKPTSENQESESVAEKFRPPQDQVLLGRYKTMLAVLERKETKLNEREDRLDEREKAIKTLEVDLKKRYAKLTILVDQRKKLIAKQEQLIAKQKALVEDQKSLADARINHLVKAYGAMRPESAATLVNSLEEDVAVKILSAMNGRTAGKIMAFVNPGKAAVITKKLSELKIQSTPPKS